MFRNIHHPHTIIIFSLRGGMLLLLTDGWTNGRTSHYCCNNTMGHSVQLDEEWWYLYLSSAVDVVQLLSSVHCLLNSPCCCCCCC